MKTSEKNQLLDKLSVAYNRVSYLLALCEEQGLAEEAVQLARRKDRLKLEIDGLLRDISSDWIGQSQAVKKTLTQFNTDIQKAIKDIEKKIKLAENIAKAIGYVDDVIKIAADLVK